MNKLKNYNVMVKAVKEVASSDLQINIKNDTETKSYTRRCRQDLREALVLTDSRHDLYEMYGYNATASWTKLPWPTRIAEGTINLNYVFHACSKLTEVDLSQWDTSSVTNMVMLFSGLSQLKELDISNLDTSNVTRMDNLFSSVGRSNSEPIHIIGLEDLNVSKVESMNNLFRTVNVKELNLSKWDVSNVQSMAEMFRYSNVEFIDITNWDTSKVTSFQNMFDRCDNLREVRGVFDMSSSYDKLKTLELTSYGKKPPKLEKPIQLKNVPRGLYIYNEGGLLEILSYKEN